MLTAALRAKVDKLWDNFWSGGIANPLTAIEQISYLLFMRRLDEADQKRVEDARFLGLAYASLFEGREDLRWRSFRNFGGEEMLAHVRDRVFPFIKGLRAEEQPFAVAMQDAVFIIPKPALLVEAVAIIDELYAEIERERQANGQTFHDTQGDLYEFLLSEISTAGKNGQFRTPRHIIGLICALVDPKLGDEICDPAAGTCGFLLGAYQHILTAHTSDLYRRLDENCLMRGTLGDKLTDERQWALLRERTFHGYDFDTTMVRIGLMNLMLHGIDQPNVVYMDTLSKRFGEQGRYDVVLANPPFKGSIDKGDINEDLHLGTTKTELLFVERIISLLRMGGRAGVIVPDGVLFGSSKAHRALRELLLDRCELQGVVSMPSGVFRPYAGVSTAILIFVKGGCTEHVWFYDMQSDGYSLDDKRAKIDATDLPDVLARWCARDPTLPENADRRGKAFTVPVAEIRANKYDLSINRYKDIAHEAVEYDPPRVILGRLRALEAEIAADLEELGGMVG